MGDGPSPVEGGREGGKEEVTGDSPAKSDE